MYEHQRVIAEGSTVRIVHVHNKGKPDELHRFDTPEEAAGRARIINEAMTWMGTPFVDCGDIKGPKGAVDCAMFLTRVTVDTETLPPFDPRPYNPRALLHSTEEAFLGWIEDKLQAKRVDVPRLADVCVYHWGKVFAHGAFIINEEEVIHAYGHARCVLISRRDEAMIKNISLGRFGTWERPVRFYDVWSR